MKVYHYDQATGLFLGATKATESPKEKGVFLVPANATTIKPDLELKKGHAPRFVNGEWLKQAYYNKDKMFDADNDYAEVLAVGFDERNLVAELPAKVKSDREKKAKEDEEKEKIVKEIAENRNVLNSTDYKIIRHLEEKEAGGKQTLSVGDFQELLSKRAKARAKINELEV